MRYSRKDDVLHLVVSDEPEAHSVEICPGVTVELSAKGELIGYEILNASEFVREAVLAKLAANRGRREADRRDVQTISRCADALNGEAEDVLGYQVRP